MNFQHQGPVTLRTNLADYPVTMAIKNGDVSSPNINFDFCGPKTAHHGFKGMVRDNKFDAGELAIITFLQAKAYGKPYVLLPAPISGRFQHHCIAYAVKGKPMQPKDIEGKRVGVRSYAQTTGLWVRGVLQHEYGVNLDAVTWVTFEDGHLAEYQDPPNCVRVGEGKLDQMMFDGEVDAAILGSDMPKDPRITTLVPNPHEAAKAWHQRTGAIPINHIFAVHESLSKSRPDVIKDLFRMIIDSRKASGVANLPPFGVEANRTTFELAIDWSYEQKIIPRRLKVDELFDDVTGSLEP